LGINLADNYYGCINHLFRVIQKNEFPEFQITRFNCGNVWVFLMFDLLFYKIVKLIIFKFFTVNVNVLFVVLKPVYYSLLWHLVVIAYEWRSWQDFPSLLKYKFGLKNNKGGLFKQAYYCYWEFQGINVRIWLFIIDADLKKIASFKVHFGVIYRYLWKSNKRNYQNLELTNTSKRKWLMFNYLYGHVCLLKT
jgi:hypothetical protein